MKIWNSYININLIGLIIIICLVACKTLQMDESERIINFGNSEVIANTTFKCDEKTVTVNQSTLGNLNLEFLCCSLSEEENKGSKIDSFFRLSFQHTDQIAFNRILTSCKALTFAQNNTIGNFIIHLNSNKKGFECNENLIDFKNYRYYGLLFTAIESINELKIQDYWDVFIQKKYPDQSWADQECLGKLYLEFSNHLETIWNEELIILKYEIQ